MNHDADDKELTQKIYVAVEKQWLSERHDAVRELIIESQIEALESLPQYAEECKRVKESKTNIIDNIPITKLVLKLKAKLND